MNNLWVARDATFFEEDESIPAVSIYSQEPVNDDQGYWSGVSGFATDIPREMFPDILPGECRRLVLADKESE